MQTIIPKATKEVSIASIVKIIKSKKNKKGNKVIQKIWTNNKRKNKKLEKWTSQCLGRWNQEIAILNLWRTTRTYSHKRNLNLISLGKRVIFRREIQMISRRETLQCNKKKVVMWTFLNLHHMFLVFLNLLNLKPLLLINNHNMLCNYKTLDLDKVYKLARTNKILKIHPPILTLSLRIYNPKFLSISPIFLPRNL